MNPAMRELAERLVSSEIKDSGSRQSEIEASFSVCEKLRQELVVLTGVAGFCALLSRTLALLHKEDVQRLGITRIRMDGSLEKVDHSGIPDTLEAPAQDPVILPAQLLDLLSVFIGEPMTVQIVEKVWPELDVSELRQSNADQTEGAHL
ncbi:MAG: hypothetical protein WCL08_03450 [Verrucomicrobiota bacterium]